MAEHIFYMAGAVVVNAYAIGDCLLWLLDQSNTEKVNSWRAGSPIPTKECVRASYQYTFGQPGPHGEIHHAGDDVLRLLGVKPVNRFAKDITTGLRSPATIAISKSLWETIPAEDRPLPPLRLQDYRLRVVMRKDTANNITAYMGFHVKALTGGAQPIIKFFDWTEDKEQAELVLGVAQVDLTRPIFDPPSNNQTTIRNTPDPGDTGALFISVNDFSQILDQTSGQPFLLGPKVPYGAQHH